MNATARGGASWHSSREGARSQSLHEPAQRFADFDDSDSESMKLAGPNPQEEREDWQMDAEPGGTVYLETQLLDDGDLYGEHEDAGDDQDYQQTQLLDVYHEDGHQCDFEEERTSESGRVDLPPGGNHHCPRGIEDFQPDTADEDGDTRGGKNEPMEDELPVVDSDATTEDEGSSEMVPTAAGGRCSQNLVLSPSGAHGPPIQDPFEVAQKLNLTLLANQQDKTMERDGNGKFQSDRSTSLEEDIESGLLEHKRECDAGRDAKYDCPKSLEPIALQSFPQKQLSSNHAESLQTQEAIGGNTDNVNPPISLASMRAASMRMAALRPLTWQASKGASWNRKDREVEDVTKFQGLKALEVQKFDTLAPSDGICEQLALLEQETPDPDWMGENPRAISRTPLRVFERRAPPPSSSSRSHLPALEAGNTPHVVGTERTDLDKSDMVVKEKESTSKSLRRFEKLMGGGDGDRNNTKSVGEVAEKGARSVRKLFSGTEASKEQRSVEKYGGLLSKEHRNPIASGLSPTGSLSYLDSQDPGEESQARALDCVDKLVWLNTTSSPQELLLQKETESSHHGARTSTVRALHPLAQVAEAHAPRDPLGVFQWVDSQHDEAGPSFGAANTGEIVSLPVQIDGSKVAAGEPCQSKKRGHTSGKGSARHTRRTRKGQVDWAQQQHVSKERDKNTKVLPEKESLNVPLSSSIPAVTVPSLKKLSPGNQEVATMMGQCEPERLGSGLRGILKTRDLEIQAPDIFLNASPVNREEIRKRLEGKRREGDEQQEPKEQKVQAAGPDTQLAVEALEVMCNGYEFTAADKAAEVDRGESGHDCGQKESRPIQIATRSRVQGRNRRATIATSDVVSLDQTRSTIERRVSWVDEVEKGSNTARKRKSSSSVLPVPRAPNTRQRKEDKRENFNKEDDVTLQKSRKDPSSMVAGDGGTSKSGRKTKLDTARKKGETEGPTAVNVEKERKRIKLSEATVSRLLGSDDEKERSVDKRRRGVECRSLSPLPGRRPVTSRNVALGVGTRSAGKGAQSLRRGHGALTSSEEVVDPRKLSKRGTDMILRCSDAIHGANAISCSLNLPEVSEGIQGISPDTVTTRGRAKRARINSKVATPPAVMIPTVPSLSMQVPAAVTGRSSRNAVAKTDVTGDQELEPQTISPIVSTPGKSLKGTQSTRNGVSRKRKEPLALTFVTGGAPESGCPGEGKRQKRQIGPVHVLFSHGLAEDIMKQQRKILGRLGGQVVTTAGECTHFVAEKFVRTRNMVEAMAAGKPVVTTMWLESCAQASCFLDERQFILQDVKKERELGFSMCSTLAAALRKPLLQGIRVFITPNTKPGPAAVAAVVKAAGGQVVDKYSGPSPKEDPENYCLVISDEEDKDVCISLLQQGAKVYLPELISSGIVTHHLDLSINQLFKNCGSRRKRSRR